MTLLEIANVLMEIANVLMTIALAIIGLYLAHSYRRQLRLRVAEQRLTAYRALWSKMSFASPVRLTTWIAQPLTQEERERLFQDLTAWYYENGNGMFLGDSTRAIYLRVKDNLRCPVECYEPESIRKELEELSPEKQDQARGYLSIRQLSLLRNRMKADLEVYGLPYHTDLDEYDKALLQFLNEDLTKKPWATQGRETNRICPNVKVFGEEEARS